MPLTRTIPEAVPWARQADVFTSDSPLFDIATAESPQLGQSELERSFKQHQLLAERRLEELLPGVAVGPRAQQCGPGTPCLIRTKIETKELDRVVHLVDRYVVTGDLGNGRGQLVLPDVGRAHDPPIALQTGRHGGTSPVQLAPEAVLRALREGKTIILNEAETRLGILIRELSYCLAVVLAASVQTNVYLSADGAVGFGAHWDDHDVLIIQLRGQKLWDVAQPAELAPLRGHSPDHAGGEVVWSGILRSGDALYIPRGWLHEVSSVGTDPSLHLTISLARPTPVQLIAMLPNPVRQLDADPRASLLRAMRVWRARLTQPVEYGPLELAGYRKDDYVGVEFRWASPGGPIVLGEGQMPDSVRIGGQGGVLDLPRALLPGVNIALERWWWTRSDLADAGLSSQKQVDLLDLLTEARVVTMRGSE